MAFQSEHYTIQNNPGIVVRESDGVFPFIPND